MGIFLYIIFIIKTYVKGDKMATLKLIQYYIDKLPNSPKTTTVDAMDGELWDVFDNSWYYSIFSNENLTKVKFWGTSPTISLTPGLLKSPICCAA